MIEILLATRNRHKAAELSAMFPENSGIIFFALSDFPGIPETIEDGLTLEENAAKKASSAAKACGKWALADDTGLEVDFLNGRPGVKSARFAGENADYAANNQKLLAELSGVKSNRRNARFRCVMALASPEGRLILEEGSVSGSIADTPRGSNGFGYDPLFLVQETGKTFAELSAEEKNKISHRTLAVRKIIPHIKNLPPNE